MTTPRILEKIRNREPVVGYWVVMDCPASTERIARLGYDYVCFDGQHGLMGYSGILNGMLAVDGSGKAAGFVRVAANDLMTIGRALDAGAVGIIVPLINSAQDAAAAVSATRYPPVGRRSYGPMRSGLRIGPTPADANASTAVFAMIETPQGLENVEEICRTPGLDGIYIGPSDLCIAVGGAFPGDPSVDDVFNDVLQRVRAAAEQAGVAAGIHTPDGTTASRRLAEGFTFCTISSDLIHLETAAREHLSAARG